MNVLAYTSPARGHLNPMMGPLLELARRGATVHVRTLEPAVAGVRAAGVHCLPIDPRIEAIALEDYRGTSPPDALRRTFDAWGRRAQLEVEDFRRAVRECAPDVALVDTTTFGAKAAAEALGLPWAESRPFLLEDAQPGVPVFPFGFKPARGPLARARDWLLRHAVARLEAKTRMPMINASRAAAGLPPLTTVADSRHRAPLTVYFTATPFEYERPLPRGVVMVGAADWEPAGDLPSDVPDRALVLVTCSSEYQDDAAIAAAALEGLPPTDRLVVTTAGVDPAKLPARPGAIVRRYLPHGPLLERAAVVICHGGMGITQKALLHGVPVCVVPWARDQLEVAARVEVAGAGVALSRRRLTPERLAEAVERARRCVDGARRVREGYEKTGGSAAAADALERLARASAASSPGDGAPTKVRDESVKVVSSSNSL